MHVGMYISVSEYACQRKTAKPPQESYRQPANRLCSIRYCGPSYLWGIRQNPL